MFAGFNVFFAMSIPSKVLYEGFISLKSDEIEDVPLLGETAFVVLRKLFDDELDVLKILPC